MKEKNPQMTKIILALGLLSILMPALALAQPFPTKPISIVVGSAPGGTMDITTRLLASKAEKLVGQPFSVSNNGAAAGSVALGILAKQKPDGYQLVSTVVPSLILMPQLRKVPYHYEEFTPVMGYGIAETGVVVQADSPWKTMKDLVEYARKNPGKVTYGTAGVGTPMHLAMEFVAKQEGIQWTHIPYPGSAAVLAALLGGHVTAESGATEWIPHVKEGKLRLLATHGEKRIKTFPQIPTFRELGYDFVNNTMFLIMAPKGTPPAVVGKLDDAFHKAMDDPEFTALMSKVEMTILYRNSADMKKFLEAGFATFKKLIPELKILREAEKK